MFCTHRIGYSDRIDGVRFALLPLDGVAAAIAQTKTVQPVHTLCIEVVGESMP
jgi:hypothetical protein